MAVMGINEGERCSLEKQEVASIYYPGTYRTDRASLGLLLLQRNKEYV